MTYASRIKDELNSMTENVQKWRDDTLFNEIFDNIKDHPVAEQNFLLALAQMDLAARYFRLAAMAIKV